MCKGGVSYLIGLSFKRRACICFAYRTFSFDYTYTHVYRAMHRLHLCDLTAKLWRRFGAPTIHQRSITAGDLLVYGSEVSAARSNGLPIVALESTIITHGMPYPDNLNTALKVEQAVRKQGAVPATIGLVGGRVHVGLNNEQLEALSRADPARTAKCSRRDICWIVSRGLNGGTTVSATMLIAHTAGIPIMATGGVGGVHRNAELTLDISTDLTELGRTPVAVVCSGVKSILDIGRTLEYLETQGVPVIKIGETPEFPAFYCSETVDKIEAPCRVSDAKEAADIVRAQRRLGVSTGMLFAVPIPEKYALEPGVVDSAISEALRRADDANVTGKRVTPFLLSEINKITRGRSLEANMALVENNAGIAAKIASNLSEKLSASHAGLPSVRSIISKKKPVVVGGAVLDTVLQVKEPEINCDGRVHAGRSRHSCGGVGRNVADALIKLGLGNTRLISVVGDDEHGRVILGSLGAGGETVKRTSGVSTARFTVIVDAQGECRFCVSEMESFSSITPELIKEHRSHLEEASLIVMDGNLGPDTARCVLDFASRANVPVWFEPTDVKTATKIFEAGPRWKGVLHFVSPNRNELKLIARHFGIPVPENPDLAAVRSVAERLNEHVPVVITTLGSQGVLVTRRAPREQPFYDENGQLIADSPTASRLYPVADDAAGEVLSVSGCGDCLAAGMIYGIHRNLDEVTCVSVALRAAALSLRSYETVPQTLAALSERQ